MPGGLELTPSDPLTDLPLTVLTKGEDFYLEGAFGERYFHHRHHPGTESDLGNDTDGVALPLDDPNSLEGLAVRHSSGQDLPRWLHEQYHDLFYGPQLPTESQAKHQAVLLGLANVVPRQAIHIYEQGAFRLVELDDKQHDFIRKRVHYEGAGKLSDFSRRGRLGRYVADYALRNYLPEIMDEKEVKLGVERFMDLKEQTGELLQLVITRDREDRDYSVGLLEKSRKQKKQLADAGNFVVQQATVASVESIRPLLKEVADAGMMQGTKRDIGQVAVKFFGDRRFPDFTPMLEQYIRLASSPNEDGQTEANELRLVA